MLRVAEHWSGTDTGLQRRANEDSLLVRSPLFVVADGMGGAQAGEVASSVAVDTFRAGLEDGENPERSLVTQVEQANSRINELSHSNAEHAGMGTTITAVYVGEQDVAIAHVGDSRAYCLREGELLRLTDDHSLVDELIRQGKLTPEEAEEHPQRSVITRALGPEATVEVDVRSFRGRPHDVYLLCSDGLTTMVGEAELLRLLAAHERLADAGEALIAAANGAGGKDNITVVLLRLEEVFGEAERSSDGHTTITAVAAVPLASSQSQERTSIPISQAVAERADEVPGQSLSVNGKQAQSPSPRRPRWPEQASQPAKSARLRRRLRRVRALVVLSIVAGLLAAAAYLALQSVYFIGTNQRGLVTMYNGLPYELPGKIKLYTSDYVSGVSASTIVPTHRQALLDHSLRSEGDAAELMRELELGQLSEG
ncbi:MAG TPA: Stp1/IreP family PP2C-type Ser/Thr phosphatase [Solirubrobacteraceae bacterium]|jgi:protein phosphatase|nr:Stp1/IreP family PP2C-type Ser/Thr phosphatase [Solirubrobacteraceae bacterium]